MYKNKNKKLILLYQNLGKNCPELSHIRNPTVANSWIRRSGADLKVVDGFKNSTLPSQIMFIEDSRCIEISEES